VVYAATVDPLHTVAKVVETLDEGTAEASTPTTAPRATTPEAFAEKTAFEDPAPKMLPPLGFLLPQPLREPLQPGDYGAAGRGEPDSSQLQQLWQSFFD
jgi:hypothetical protein